MIHEHHRKRRSQGGDDSAVNVIRIPDALHQRIHDNPEWAYENGLLVKSHDDPSEVKITIPEDVVKPARAPRKKPEGPRQKSRLLIHVPEDEREKGTEVLETLIQSAREKLAPEMGWDDDVPAYFVLTAVLHDWLTTTPTTEEGAL